MAGRSSSRRAARPPARPKTARSKTARSKTARPARPKAGKAAGGSRVSGSVSVSPKASFTLFGGSLFSFTFGGGGRRARRGRAGLLSRLTGVARRAYGEMTGRTAGPSPAGGKGAGRSGRSGSFEDFRDARPDLFDDDPRPGPDDDVVDVDPAQDDPDDRDDRDDRSRGGGAR